MLSSHVSHWRREKSSAFRGETCEPPLFLLTNRSFTGDSLGLPNLRSACRISSVYGTSTALAPRRTLAFDPCLLAMFLGELHIRQIAATTTVFRSAIHKCPPTSASRTHPSNAHVPHARFVVSLMSSIHEEWLSGRAPSLPSMFHATVGRSKCKLTRTEPFICGANGEMNETTESGARVAASDLTLWKTRYVGNSATCENFRRRTLARLDELRTSLFPTG